MSASDEDAEAERPARPHDLRLVPSAAAAWLAMVAATTERLDLVLALAGVSLAVAGLAAWRRRWLVLAASVVALSCLLSGGIRAAHLASDPLRSLGRQRATVSVTIEIAGEVRMLTTGANRSPTAVLRGTVVEIDGRGRAWHARAPVTILASGDGAARWASAPVGSVVRADGRAEPPEPGDGVAATVRVREAPHVIRGPSLGLWAAERVRAALRESVARQPAEPRALLPALVVGDTSGLDASLDGDFKTTALTHLSAVSGANLALLLVFVLGVARTLGVRGRWLRVISAACVAAFVVLCRGEPSVLRAAAMGLVTLAALGSGARDGAGIRALGVAVIALLYVDPWLCRSWGFGLSVAASLGIIGWGRRWSDALASWCPRPLADAIAIPLAAQLATQPIITALSGSVSIVGLLANALAGPLVGPATVCGLMAAVATLAWPAFGALIAAVGCWCAQGIVLIARWGAGLPGASVQWPASPVGLALLAAAVVLLGLGMGPLLRRSWAVVAVAIAMLATLLHGPTAPGWPPGRWDVVMCDVGQGDALVARAGPGAAVVVDTGPDPVVLRRCLDGLGIRAVPLLILTHDHADHVGGLDAVLARRLDVVLESPLASPARGRIDARLRGAGAHARHAAPGEVVDVGSVRWRTVSVGGGIARDATGEGESSAENDASVIGIVEVGELRVLLTGDAEPGGQDAAVAAGFDLSCDALKVPHHGSSRQSPDLLQRSGASVALFSVGAKNDYGHPTLKTLRAVAGLGMRTVRTDESGAIAVAKQAGRITVTTEHEARPVAAKRRS